MSGFFSDLFSHRARPSRRQRGFSLPVALIMLFAASLLAAAGALLSSQNSQNASGVNDRQKALFVAEGTLRVAETATQTFVTANLSNISGAMASPPSGFYLRANAPTWSPWASASAVSTQIDPSLPNGQYYVVYEGATAITGTGFANGSGSGEAMAANLYKFTIYAYAAGARTGTQVILAVHHQYSQ